jgi:hypothetical protein
MALLGNYSVYDKMPLRFTSGAGVQNGARGNFAESGRVRNRMMQSQTTNADEYYALPNGGYPSLTWFIPQKVGQIGSSNQIYGQGVSAGNLAGGLNAISDLSGTGTISNGNLTLIAQLIAALTGAGDVTPPPSLVGTLQLLSDLSGAGAIAATLAAYADVQASLTGNGTLTLTPYAIGELSADITGESALSPQNLAAAVWNAIAAQYNTAGTMGNKLNSAASGGVDYHALGLAVWNILQSDVGAAGTMGEALESALKLPEFIALQNP